MRRCRSDVDFHKGEAKRYCEQSSHNKFVFVFMFYLYSFRDLISLRRIVSVVHKDHSENGYVLKANVVQIRKAIASLRQTTTYLIILFQFFKRKYFFYLIFLEIMSKQ